MVKYGLAVRSKILRSIWNLIDFDRSYISARQHTKHIWYHIASDGRSQEDCACSRLTSAPATMLKTFANKFVMFSIPSRDKQPIINWRVAKDVEVKVALSEFIVFKHIYVCFLTGFSCLTRLSVALARSSRQGKRSKYVPTAGLAVHIDTIHTFECPIPHSSPTVWRWCFLVFKLGCDSLGPFSNEWSATVRAQCLLLETEIGYCALDKILPSLPTKKSLKLVKDISFLSQWIS